MDAGEAGAKTILNSTLQVCMPLRIAHVRTVDDIECLFAEHMLEARRYGLHDSALRFYRGEHLHTAKELAKHQDIKALLMNTRWHRRGKKGRDSCRRAGTCGVSLSADSRRLAAAQPVPCHIAATASVW